MCKHCKKCLKNVNKKISGQQGVKQIETSCTYNMCYLYKYWNIAKTSRGYNAYINNTNESVVAI